MRRVLRWAGAAAILALFMAAVVWRFSPAERKSAALASSPAFAVTPGLDPATTDPRVDLAAARTVAPDARGAWTTIGNDRLALAPAPPID